jgi:hypothetical protein
VNHPQMLLCSGLADVADFACVLAAIVSSGHTIGPRFQLRWQESML